jgi:hypothetical protein
LRRNTTQSLSWENAYNLSMPILPPSPSGNSILISTLKNFALSLTPMSGKYFRRSMAFSRPRSMTLNQPWKYGKLEKPPFRY